MTVLKLRGFEIHKSFLDLDAQIEVLEAARAGAAAAPLFQPETHYG